MDGTRGAAAGRVIGAGFCAAPAAGAAAVLGWLPVGSAVFKAGAAPGGGAIGADAVTGLGAPVGPPGGSVGSLMVGAAVGLGGKLMRTVSFLG